MGNPDGEPHGTRAKPTVHLQLAICPEFERPATESSCCKRCSEEPSNITWGCVVDCGSGGSNFCDGWESSQFSCGEEVWLEGAFDFTVVVLRVHGRWVHPWRSYCVNTAEFLQKHWSLLVSSYLPFPVLFTAALQLICQVHLFCLFEQFFYPFGKQTLPSFVESLSCHHCRSESADRLVLVQIAIEFSPTPFCFSVLQQRLYGQLAICDAFHKFRSDKSSFLGCDLYVRFVPVSWNVISFAIVSAA